MNNIIFRRFFSACPELFVYVLHFNTFGERINERFDVYRQITWKIRCLLFSFANSSVHRNYTVITGEIIYRQ